MNLLIKTGVGIKTHVSDPNFDVENENLLTDFSWQIWAKNTIFSSESVKTKEHKESNSCEKYYFLIDAFYKINFWPILKKLSQKIDFRHFPLFEIIAHLLMYIVQFTCDICCGQSEEAWKKRPINSLTPLKCHICESIRIPPPPLPNPFQYFHL